MKPDKTAQCGRLHIGWGRRDVSTTEPVVLPGQFHLRISEGILDPVTVNALVMENSHDVLAFLSCDLVGLDRGMLTDIREKLHKLVPDFPAEKLILNVTHTHAGPDCCSVFGNPASAIPLDRPVADRDAYRRFWIGQAAEAVAEAWKNRAPGEVAWGYGYASTSHSRRVVYFDDISQRLDAVGNSLSSVDGHAKMYGNTNDDKFSHYEAGTDDIVNLLYTFDAGKKLTGTLINIPCPSQNSEAITRLSASFWHEVRVALRKEYGEEFGILPQCSAAGDLAPRLLHYVEAQKRRFRLKYGREPRFDDEFERAEIAERIVDTFHEVLAYAKKELFSELPIEHRVQTVELPKRMITEAEREQNAAMLDELNREPFASEGPPAERQFHDSILAAKRVRSRQVLERYESQKRQPALPMELHVARLGNIAFATNRFELYMDYMHRIQARSPFEQTFVIQLSGTPEGCGSYLASERGVADRGYSASLYCTPVTPEGGQKIVDVTVTELKDMFLS